jgi:replicative DNA helicase
MPQYVCLEAEMATLACCIKRNDSIPEVARVLPGSYMFSLPVHGKIYDTILKLYRNGPVDLVILGEAVSRNGMVGQLRHGYAYLADLWDYPCAGHAASYATIVRDKWLRRKAVKYAHDFLAAAETGRPIRDLLDSFKNAINSLCEGTRT